MKNTILLVDDEEDIRDVLSISLSDMGFEVHTAENAEEALRIYKTIGPEIVLTDIKMPGMDGIDLLKKIKQENSETEVIMITGHGDTDLAIKSLKYEATDFITKPINIDALEISIKRAGEKIITRLKLKEYTENLEALLREKSALQDHLSSLGYMISSISHGIKGLLTRLDAGIYLLGSSLKKKDYEETKEGLDIVKHTADRIKKMVIDILYYAKERELKTEKIDVLSFADDVADVIESKIQGHRIELIRAFDDVSMEFEIDEQFLSSALINILDNAVDACTGDALKKEHKIIFGVKEDKTNIIFDIQDNGTGMDSATTKKIFDLFFSSKASRGTGLGLFISNNIIKQHNGIILVNSVKDKGTLFKIKIPKTRRITQIINT